MYRVLGYIFMHLHMTFDLDIGVKMKCYIMNFIVNASPPKPLAVATLNYACA